MLRGLGFDNLYLLIYINVHLFYSKYFKMNRHFYCRWSSQLFSQNCCRKDSVLGVLLMEEG